MLCIENTKNIKSGTSFIGIKPIKPKTSEIKMVQANALDIMSNQGRAFVNMECISFRGNLTPKLSNEDFEQRKKELQEKFETFPPEIQEEYNKIEFSEYNTPFAERFFDSALSHNPHFLEVGAKIISAIDNKYKFEISNRILDIEEKEHNPQLFEHTEQIISDIDCNFRAEFAKKVLSRRELYGNPNLTGSMNSIIPHIWSKKESNAKCRIIDKILSKQKLRSNKSIGEELANIIKYTRPGDESSKSQVINKILANPEICENKSIQEHFGEIISTTFSQQNADAKCQIIDYLSDKPEFLQSECMQKNLGIILTGYFSCLYPHLVCEMIDKFLSRADFIQNKNITDNFSLVINQVNSEKEIPIAERVLEKIKDDPDSLTLDEINQIINGYLTCEEAEKLNKTIGINNVKRINMSDLPIASKLITLYNINSLDEIPVDKKKEVIGALVSSNYNWSRKNSIPEELFPLVPNNLDEYCKLLHDLVESLGINGKSLGKIKIAKTNKTIFKMAQKIKSNEEIDSELNKITKVFPEIKDRNRADLEKTLKGIIKNPEFDKLSDSDKKIILLAGLLSDIEKDEPKTSAFFASIVTNRIGLNQDEKFKLHTLISNSDWINYIERDDEEKNIQKRLMDTAYDFRFDNLFDMELILTKVKNNIDNPNQTNYEQKIRENIEELKKSQPLLPVTKIPKASVIDKAITKVKEDGSTNIKGVYKDKKGLVIIKFNEVEDWEKIGFPKGTTSSGIKTKTSKGDEVDTGNIHFFVHGLEYPIQLAKFDAFSMFDSDALLSVSYAERPESKCRFFRPQGILLDCDTKYIHGGGETDSGSGCGKDIQEFKNR